MPEGKLKILIADIDLLDAMAIEFRNPFPHWQIGTPAGAARMAGAGA